MFPEPISRRKVAFQSTRTRLFAMAVIVLVIPVGLVARSHRADADESTLLGFVATYLGDTLWPVMFYFFGRFCWPSLRKRFLLAATLALTLTIEFGQIWQPQWLQWLRSKPGIGFILGNSFIWSDVVCCILGSLAAISVDWVRQRCGTTVDTITNG